MKFRNLIHEVLEEQLRPTYKPSYTGYYYKTPKGIWQLSFDVAKKPKDAIEVESIYPDRSVGGVPNTLSDSELRDAQQQARTVQMFKDNLNPNKQKYQANIPLLFGNGSAPPYQPPVGWQEQEKSYAKFNEPMGKMNTSVKGKYRTIPPQVNQYYWDPEAKNNNKIQQMDRNGNITYKETTGAWVRKTLENVDSWRDVPSGFLPFEYGMALKWVADGGGNPEYRGKMSIKASPYYHKDYPLGISVQDLESRDKLLKANKDREAANKIKKLNPLDVVNRNDTVDPGKFERERNLENILYKESVKNIDDFYGRYKQTQQESGEDGYDWIGFLVTVASFIPVTAPFARVVSGGLGIMKAIEKYNKGDAASAGIDLLFTFAPGVSKLASKANVLNAITVGKESTALKQVLEQHADEWFSTVKSGIANVVQNSTAKTLANATVDTIGKQIKSNLEDYSIKHGSKLVAKNVDARNKKQQAI